MSAASVAGWPHTRQLECADRWATLYPDEVRESAGHSCYYKRKWNQVRWEHEPAATQTLTTRSCATVSVPVATRASP